MNKFNIDMGKFVTDEVTGFSGVINGRCIWATGNTQYSIKPPIDDKGVMPGSMWIDEDYLKVVEDKGVDCPYGQPIFQFGMGDKVASTKTPFKGFVTGQCQWLNGCIEYYTVSEKLSERTGNLINEWFPETEIKLLKSQAIKQEQRATGGPDRASPR